MDSLVRICAFTGHAGHARHAEVTGPMRVRECKEEHNVMRTRECKEEHACGPSKEHVKLRVVSERNT